MKFSDIYKIKNAKDETWFDPMLTIDSKLFIDPFLIYDNEFGEFIGSHDDIIDLFTRVFELLATVSDTENINLTRAHRLLLFPEVEALCLGFTSEGTNGAGTGIKAAKSIASGILQAIGKGKTNFAHFEEVQLFQKGIAQDSISDAVGNILWDRFAKYTFNICQTHQIELHEFTRKRAKYDKSKKRWVSKIYRLPKNPYNGKAIILTPKCYLNKLPSLNAGDYLSYCGQNFTSLIVQEFGDDILKSIPKEKIVNFALAYPKTREEYINFLESTAKAPYDFDKDELGFYKFWDSTNVYLQNKNSPLGKKSFNLYLKELFLDFQNFIENEDGWRLLWNDNDFRKAKAEYTAQTLFYMFVKRACHLNNIVISKEANIGRGPVDFKLSQSVEHQCLIEAKLIRNSKFWNGLEKQLPKYLKSESIKNGFFLIFAYTDADLDKIIDIEKKTTKLSKSLGYDIETIVIDARRNPLSASKL